MTVMIPEAVEAAGGRAAAGRTAQGRVISRRDRRVYDTYGTRTRRSTPPQGGPSGRRGVAVSYTPTGSGGGGGGLGGGYQGAILAEFLAAVLVVSFMPLASGAPNDGKAGPSPYRVSDLEQLAAIGVTYFLLALLAQGDHGKMAAWFGGLILLGIGFKKMMSGQFSAAVSGLTGQPVPAEAGPYTDPATGSGGGGGGHAETVSEQP